MAAVYDTDQALATFRCGGVDPNLFLLVNWRGSEAVSKLYKFEVELASADDNIDLENLLGRRATLAVSNQQGEIMPWHGIITAIKQTKRDETYAYYAATLEPQLALLRLFRQSRVYMHADQHSGGEPDLSDVIRMILEQIGLSQEGEASPDYTPDYSIRIPSSDLADTRSNFICQFEETSLNFLQRKLEHEGVYFWFEQGSDREVVVFGNQQGQQPSDDIDVYWRDQGEINPETDKIAINRFDHRMQVQPKSVVLREFSVQQPSLDLTINTDVDPQATAPLDRFDGMGTIEVYGSHYKKQDHGNSIANLRAQELATTRNTYEGKSVSPGIRAGYSINLHEHFRDDVNAKYYVLEIQHEGSQSLPRQSIATDSDESYYRASFTVIPEAVQFRPARTARKPRVIGFLSAIIEAEGDGEYAEMNEYGCYRIRFLFAPPGAGQQGDANSAWVRMATPYAGSQHGLNLPLLKGTEVLVSFLGGDPDRPVIISAIPNEENPSIRNQNNASQPALQTAGQNMLNFEDKKDSESVRLSTPKAQSTLHLGNDPDKPDATGIRMATVGHMGDTSSSYIRDIPGIYTQEIGKLGSVAKDPAQDKAVKAAMADNKAKQLMEQATMPNAEPAVQMSALQAQQELADSNIDMVNAMLGKALNSSLKDDAYIADLQNRLASLTAKGDAVSSLVADVASGNKSPGDVINTMAADDAAAASDDSPPADKEEKSSGSSTKSTDGLELSVHNQMYYGATNSIFLGATSSTTVGATNATRLGVVSLMTFGLSSSLTVAGTISVTEGGAKAFKLFGSHEFNTTYFKKSVKSKEEAADKSVKAGTYDISVGDLNTESIMNTVKDTNYKHKSSIQEIETVSYKCKAQDLNIQSNYCLIKADYKFELKSKQMIFLKAGSSKAYISPLDFKLDASFIRLA